MKYRYVLHQQRRSGKHDRWSVFDTLEKRDIMGKLEKSQALDLMMHANGKGRQPAQRDVEVIRHKLEGPGRLLRFRKWIRSRWMRFKAWVFDVFQKEARD